MAAMSCSRGSRLVLVAVLAVAGGGSARAQLPPPSPAALAEAARPVRVVCVADQPEAFLRDQTFRDRVLARLPPALPLPAAADAGNRLRALIVPFGARFIVPVGSGFVVDPARRHVVSNWHVVSDCAAGAGGQRQLAVAEADAADIAVQLAEHLPDRIFQDAAGNPVQLVQALCRDPREGCGADLPHAPDDKPPTAAQRRRQLDNLQAYAPDLAVLRLAQPLRTPPLALALQQQLDDQMHLVVRSFGPVPVGAGRADAAARLHLVAPHSVAAVYTGPHQLSFVPPGGRPDAEVHAKLHRLAAVVQPDQSGAPVLRGRGVVGVLTTMLAPPATAASSPGGPVHAVPVSVLAVFLDLLKVPFVVAAPETAPATPHVDAALDTRAPAGDAGWRDPQRLMLAGALLLALLAAAAFALLAGRRPPPPQAVPRPQQPAQRTSGRVGPTVLHAVALPTAAVDPPPLEEAALAVPLQLPAATPVVHLRCSAGPLAPAVFSLPMPNGGTTLFVGRDAQSCQLVFPAAADEVSAVHACFVWDAQQRRLTLRDLSSSGSWVNGQRVAKGRTLALSGGDRVDLGGPELNRFTIDIPDGVGPAVAEMQ